MKWRRLASTLPRWVFVRPSVGAVVFSATIILYVALEAEMQPGSRQATRPEALEPVASAGKDATYSPSMESVDDTLYADVGTRRQEKETRKNDDYVDHR